jgi:D-alanyl-lipoteichoic acid acyltransferase DltB (MBOAT superfamily)
MAMLFNSYVFLLIFLPLALVGFFLLGTWFGRSTGLLWLFAASLVFYASWEPAYLWLLLGTLVFNYCAAKMIGSLTRYKNKILVTAVISNVLLLVYYKLIIAGVTGGDLQGAAFSTTKNVLIPLGISFITFQQIAFLVDTYKGKLVNTSPLEYATFITFFPQLIMGPILHNREIQPQLRAPNLFKWCSDNFAVGLSIFIIGLFKKVVLADSFAPFVNQVHELAMLGHHISPADAWGAAIGFQFQIYFDFSGYADMAVGLAKMFNINIPINFDSPFRARDRFDHWRRWHISFGAFMRQYVFFPLARSKKLRIGNVGALMATTLLSGFWHGVGATFIVWGALQSLIMLAVHYRRMVTDRLGWFKTSKISGFSYGAMVLTFFVTLVLGVIFRSVDLTVAYSLLGSMYTGFISIAHADFQTLNDDLISSKGLVNKLLFATLVIWGLPTTQRFFNRYWTAIDQRPALTENNIPDLLPGAYKIKFALNKRWAICMGLLFCFLLLSMTESSRFIYYQF